MQLNNKKISYLIKGGLAILVLLLLIFGRGNFGKQNDRIVYINKPYVDAEQMQRELAQKDSVISRIKTESESKITWITREYSRQTLALVQKDEELQSLRKLLTDSDIKINDLQSYINVNVNTSDSSSAPIYIINEMVYSFCDTTDHLILKGTFQTDSMLLEYNYNYRANYDLLTYYSKGKGFFPKRQLMATVITDDHRAELMTKSVMIRQQKPSFHVGVGLGFSATPKALFSPSISICIFKPLIDIYL